VVIFAETRFNSTYISKFNFLSALSAFMIFFNNFLSFLFYSIRNLTSSMTSDRSFFKEMYAFIICKALNLGALEMVCSLRWYKTPISSFLRDNYPLVSLFLCKSPNLKRDLNSGISSETDLIISGLISKMKLAYRILISIFLSFRGESNTFTEPLIETALSA